MAIRGTLYVGYCRARPSRPVFQLRKVIIIMLNRPVTLALGACAALAVIGAGSGAVAATLITSEDIKDDTIKPIDLNFPVGLEAEMLEVETVTLEKGYNRILRANYSNDDEGGLATGYGVVAVENPTKVPIEVAIRLQHKGEPEHTAVFTLTLDPGESESAPASFRCNGFPAGVQTVILSVSGTGAVVTEAALSVVAAPQR
jgi:hypothetical protein